MPSFKPKPTKKIKFNKKESVTLDSTHKGFLNEFSKNEDIIINYKNEIELLNQQLNDKTDVLCVDKKLEITDKIIDLKNNIKNIKYKKKEYLLDNSKYIFEYFENKKNISVVQPTQTTANKSKLVKHFFKIKEADDDELIQQNEPNNDNNNVILKYLTNVSSDFLDINNFIYQSNVCTICHKGELIPIEEEGIIICNLCSRSNPYLIENEKPSYKEPPKEVCFYAYKRINHFKEILAQFQGKETTQIPPEVIENIIIQIKKERIDLTQITNNKTKEILKK